MLFDVAIIGYGPSGATLANLLAIYGHSVLIIDREKDLYHLPRAVHFDDEVMRVFQHIGIAEALSEKIHINPGMRFIDQQDRLLLDWPRPQRLTDHGWHASYRLHQPDLERLLRDRLAHYPAVSAITNMAVTKIEEAQEHITLSAESRITGTTHSFKSKFVVGCDGANSFVRHHMGAGMEDLGFAEDWLVIDLLLKQPRPDLGDHTIQFCYPDRPMTYCRNPGLRRRWEFALKPDEDAQIISQPEMIWQLLSKWITPEQAELERRQVYTFRSQIANSWRQGRFFLAGDAAHLTPPFMGQGMCMGIRDAANLAWKLNAVLSGMTDDTILHSYEQERSPHSRAFIETAKHLGGLINSIDTKTALSMADPRSDGHKQLRPLAPKLGKSALFSASQHHHIDVIGRPCPQFKIGQNATAMDNLIGPNHLIICKDQPDNLAPHTACITPQNSPKIKQFLDQQDAFAIWVRPDRYCGAMAPDLQSMQTRFPHWLFR